MKHNIIILLIFTLFLPLAGKGQINLVLNPSFEQYSVCPDNADETKYCNAWMSLDSSWSPPDWAHAPFGVPEYCNICSSSGWSSIPISINFNHYARNGNGMISMQMFTTLPSTPNKRDYLQGHLLQNLIAGHKYSVNFYTVMAYMSGYAVNRIGAYLDNGTIDTTHNPGFIQNQYTPQIVDTSVIFDTLNWTKIDGTFTANGTEKLITIGQFSDSAHTNNYAVTSSVSTGGNYSWYLIDDVSVIDCDNVPHAGNDTVIHPSDSAFIGTHEPLLPYKWYKLGSTTVIDSTGGIWVKPTVSTSYVVEQMLCGVKRWDTVKIWVWPDTPSHVAVEQILIGNFQLYPNPTTKELTIEGARGFDVVIYDIVGRQMLHSTIVMDKQGLDVTDLPKGVYLVQVSDIATTARNVRVMQKE